MKHQAIIFDLDGTLLDTRADLAAAVNHARGQLGFEPLRLDTVTSYVGEGLTKLIERAFDGDQGAVAPALRHFKAHYAAHLTDHTVPYEGVASGLAELARLGARMAVLTNKGEGFSRALLDHFGLTSRFAGIVGGDSLDTRKPDPAGALFLVQQMEAEPAATLMVGDHCTDLATARNAGLVPVFCEYGFGRQREEPCAHRARRFMDVVDIFRRPAVA